MSAPVRVFFTIPFGELLGGAERVLLTFLQHVDRSRVEPFVAFHADGPLVDEVAALGIGTAVVPTGRFREPHRAAVAVGRLALLMRRHRADVVAHWLNRAQAYGAPAAVLAGKGRRTMWFQRHLVDGTDPLDRVATRLPALAVGTPSRGAAEAQAARLRPRRPTFWVHNGIVPPAPAGPARLAQLRAEHDLPDDRPLVGIVGRLQPWKGQHRLLGALALLRDRGIHAHGVVVGGTQYGVDADYPAELHRLVDELGLAGRVTFTGQVERAHAFYEVLDVAVNASDQESFGLVLLEAMALGTPVVAVDHGGPAEVLAHERTGVLVPRPEAQDLADGIAWLLADDVRRRAIGAAARVELRARFTADRMARGLEDAFVALAAGRVPSSGGQPPSAAA